MKTLPKIKLLIEGDNLQAFYAIASYYNQCGKASRIGLTPNKSLKQNFKFNDADFLCVYKSIIVALNGVRYPNKKSKEYCCLLQIKVYFEREYMSQRGLNIPNT